LIIEPGQCRDKNNYYYSFKTQLEGRSEARSESQVELTIEWINVMLKIIIIMVLKLD
jgi:hypothetical protein